MDRDPAPPASSIRITNRDRELISFAAEHRLVLAAHVKELLGISLSATGRRLSELCTAGLLKRDQVFHRQPACYQVTRRGLDLVDSSLRAPSLDLRCYGHDVGVAWLWLAARAGSFGELSGVISERRLRSEDASAEARGQPPPHGVRLGGFGPRGTLRLHYPDLLLRGADGHRVALELELSRKGRARRNGILAAYAADSRVDAVLYLVADPVLGRDIAGAARAIGASAIIQVQPVRLARSGASPAAARSKALTAAAAPARGSGVCR